jgi:hypothetical protein
MVMPLKNEIKGFARSLGADLVGVARVEALEALKRSLASAKGDLKQYYLWAISTLEDTETTGINPSTYQER